MKFSLSAVLFAAVVAFSAVDASATCTAGPSWYQYPYQYYQHLYKDASPLDCWTYSPTGVTTESTYCGFTPANGIKFTGWTQQISQDVVVNNSNSGNSGTNWALSYELDFDDPHDSSSWNRIEAEVWAIDGGGSTLVGWHVFHGGDGDVSCTPRSINFTGNYNGKTMRVIIKSKRGWSDVTQRVRNISLLQWY